METIGKPGPLKFQALVSLRRVAKAWVHGVSAGASDFGLGVSV